MPTDRELDRTELTPLEHAEADAAGDVLDADVEGHRDETPPAVAPAPPASPPAVGETEIAAAEAQSDLSHVDDAG